MQLYTSLVRLKMAINGGALPPMTPVPENSRDLIDPRFTIGFGALEEHETRGLRCPIRGCGKYFHGLGHHLNRTHGDVGGISAVREKLSIPRTASLVSRQMHDRMSARSKEMIARTGGITRVARMGGMKPGRRKGIRSPSATTITSRNLRDRCEAQMRHKLIDLENKNGRPVSLGDAIAELGEGYVEAVKNAYGTWLNAKEQFGLKACKRGRAFVTREATLAALMAYYEAHGTLPNYTTAARGKTAPLMPNAVTMIRSLNATTWPQAMEFAASLLNIYGGRYGLPERVA